MGLIQSEAGDLGLESLREALGTMAEIANLPLFEVRSGADGLPVLCAVQPWTLPEDASTRRDIIQAAGVGREHDIGRSGAGGEGERDEGREAGPGWEALGTFGGVGHVIARGESVERIRLWYGKFATRAGALVSGARCLGAVGEGLVLVDGMGRVEAVSREASALLGVGAEALEGEAMAVRLPEVPVAIEPNEVVRGSLERTRPELAFQVLARRDGASGVVVRLRRHEDGSPGRARQAQFISALRHDVRSPLTSLRGLVGVLSAEPDMSHDERVRMVSLLQVEVERTVTWVEDYLVVLWLRHEMRPMHAVERPAARIVAEACAIFEEHARERGIALEVDLGLASNAGGVMVRVDPSLVTPFGKNLLGHFFRIAERGAAIRVSLGADGGLTVEGGGPGLFATHTPQPFMTIARSTAAGKRTPGVGLGLFLVKKICDVHGWSTQAEVTEGSLRVRIGWTG